MKPHPTALENALQELCHEKQIAEYYRAEAERWQHKYRTVMHMLKLLGIAGVELPATAGAKTAETTASQEAA